MVDQIADQGSGKVDHGGNAMKDAFVTLGVMKDAFIAVRIAGHRNHTHRP